MMQLMAQRAMMALEGQRVLVSEVSALHTELLELISADVATCTSRSAEHNADSEVHLRLLFRLLWAQD